MKTVRYSKNIASFNKPYPHLTVDGILSEDLTRKIVHWFDTKAEWQPHTSSFFNQFDCMNLSMGRLDGLDGLFSRPTVTYFRKLIEKHMEVDLSETRISYCAHKFTQGLGVGIHTDSPHDGTETHRLIIHLNSHFSDRFGGHLVVLNENNIGNINKIVRPVNNSAFAFELSDNSFHAVSDVEEGIRYSLIYSFWKKGLGPEVSNTRFLRSEYQLKGYISFLKQEGADLVNHTNRTLMAHLIGTANILRSWNAPRYLWLAGLFHSVYGTGSFSKALIDPERRQDIAELIGEEAERLVYIFGNLNTSQFCQDLLANDNSFDTTLLNGESMLINTSEVTSILMLILANELEQSFHLAVDHANMQQAAALIELIADRIPAAQYERILNSYNFNYSHHVL
ncbi:cyclophane-containing peptide 2OG-Fe(II) oxygenase YhhC [Dyadobacter sp. Leaf189]|uniref:cyclophane-containing peptide 2OG-Fe(II) oxygenase YhhC n=1 Tax=Dyadobacter sp. Leaf189 TaxID=1736295 RepID=UPI0006F852DA|nr:cyclophane-containing peptide 2OG-Fe(II) oxygenase YhhC [Dyadobacter sp. Leaf189]KQS27067.1 hypothetical protein ASG33_21275 [Dyadobacter sp. Leaf189]